MFESIILNAVLIFFPILLYLFYLIYAKNVEKEKNELILDFVIISSLYLLLKFGTSYITSKVFIIANIPLLIAYYKERNYMIFIISTFLVFYYHFSFTLDFLFLIIAYLIYYMAIKLFCKKNNWRSFIICFFILNMMYTCCLYFNNNLELNILFLFIYDFLVCLTGYLIILLFKQCEQILNYHISYKKLEQVKQIKLSLFKITHEIKNPIAVCKGYLDMFDTNNIEHSKKYIPILKEEISRTLILLQDFLSISKIKIEKDILDINLLIEEVMSNFTLILKEKNIKWQLNLEDDEIYINGDYNRLMQVFINIIKNSIEATLEKGNITITTKQLKNNIKITIKDDGIGMNEEVLNKVKEPFYTTKKRGTGLGVSLSSEIIKAHGGTIEYQSKENKGTKVIIYLPLYK